MGTRRNRGNQGAEKRRGIGLNRSVDYGIECNEYGSEQHLERKCVKVDENRNKQMGTRREGRPPFKISRNLLQSSFVYYLEH